MPSTADAHATRDTCYDCGGDLPPRPRLVPVLLWESPVTGAEHWWNAGVCAACAASRDRQRRVVLAAVMLFVAAVTAMAGYLLLP